MEDKNLRLVVRLSGIHCVGCFNRIEYALSEIGASNVDLDLETNIGKIDFKGDEKQADVYIKAITDIGYQAELLTVFVNE